MTRNRAKNVVNDELRLEDIKCKLGYHYARKIAAKSRRLNNRQVYDVVRGWVKNPKIINSVLKAAARAIAEEETLKNENKRLKMSLAKSKKTNL